MGKTVGAAVGMEVLLGARAVDDAGGLTSGGEGTSPLAAGLMLDSTTFCENANTAKPVYCYKYCILKVDRIILMTKILITRGK